MQKYNNPPGTPSNIGPQANVFYYQKQALIEARKEQYFTQLADSISMPKHFGKKIKRFHYIPILDDANLNDQGIDAAGVAIDSTKYTVTFAGLVKTFAVEADATAAAAAVNAVEGGVAVKTGSSTPWTVTLSKKTLANKATAAQATAIGAQYPEASLVQGSGNLYGSSKDIGLIPGKFPVLSETGGRVNRVGMKRKEIEGTIEKFGFFEEYTQESLDFDTDAELEQHINREMINAAVEMSEDMLQLDLINAAGVVKFAGSALDNDEVDETSVVTYNDLLRLSIDLDNNRTPKGTKIITGTRLIDTRTIPAARVMFVGSELLPTLKAMKDLHNQPAFISIEKYAAGGNTLTGEVGAIDQFRIVVVPEMMKWAGAGAALGGDDDHYDNGAHFDIFPMLVVGSESFTTIGFQTDGQTVKFKVTHKKPGRETADRNDPYGEMGFMSIKWYYGFMALRPERIALIKTAAKL
ncbi:MAG: N4-gp56 family major capsid protein [Hyphomicrobiaceae bacterium]|nr:MAG: N4-gp56 family major capsid protein [Hyphomicrobiaceae bacterium]